MLFVLPLLALLAGCAPEPKEKLPDVPSGSYTVTLEPTSSTLTSDDSTGPITVTLSAKEDSSVKYQVEIGAPCYIKTVDSYQEIIVKQNAYFKSISNYKVNRIICDIYEGKGINYSVFNKADGSGTALEKHSSTIPPVYPEDSGAVYEYDLNNSTEWSVRNSSSSRPGFYSVSIVFTVE